MINTLNILPTPYDNNSMKTNSYFEVNSKNNNLSIIEDVKQKENYTPNIKENYTPNIFDSEKINNLIDNNKKRTNTENKSAKKNSSKRIKRKILDLSNAPSLIQEAELKKNGSYCPISIELHGQRRVQLFAISALILWKVAERSNLKEREISIQLHGATLQVGKASNQGEHRYTASHSHASAGFSDNIRELLMIEINEDKTITEKKWRILSCKGFTQDEITQIEQNCYELEKIRDVFNKVWPKAEGEPHSLITKTPVELSLNATVETREYGNVFNGYLERYIRPQVLKLYYYLAYGKISPEEATTNYHQQILKFFNFFEEKLPERLVLLKNYKKDFYEINAYNNIFNSIKKNNTSPQKLEECFNFIEKLKLNNKEDLSDFCKENNISEKTEKKIIKNLYKINKENISLLVSEREKEISLINEKINSIKKDNENQYHAFVKNKKIQFSNIEKIYKFKFSNELVELFKKIQDTDQFLAEKLSILYDQFNQVCPPKPKKDKKLPIEKNLLKLPSIKLPKHKKFLHASSYEFQEKKTLTSFNNWMQRKRIELKREIKVQQKKLADILTYAKLEKTGTIVPDFKLLFGEFCPEEEKTVSPETLLHIQEELLKPMPPKETPKKKIRKQLNFD